MDDQAHSLGGLPAVPSAKMDDPEDVAWALSTAEAMWSRGEHADSIRWIRKAAESASEADHDTRALELAKAAAELANVLRQDSAPNVAALAEALVEKEVSAELRDVGRAIPPVAPPAAAPAPARIIGTHGGSKIPSQAPPAPPGPPPRTLKVTSSSSTLSAVSAKAAAAASQGPVAPSAPKAPSIPPAAPAAPGAQAVSPSIPPPAAKPESMPPTTRVSSPTHPHHDNPTRPRQKLLTPTDIVHVPQRRPNPDATTELHVGRELRAMVKEMAKADEPTIQKPSRPPPPPTADSTVKPSQAVHVIVWRDATGVHVAPAGTVVSSITVDAMLVALDPNADLSAWLEARKPR